ncbi:MAG: penicillin-binding protein activator [Bdellovibrionota bacterium]
MKTLLAFFAVIFLAIPASAETKLKMGALLPLSGEVANIGEACRNGMELAKSNLEPEIAKKLDLIFEDDALLSKTSVSAFNKLVTEDKIDLAVSFSSGTSKALAPIADSKNIPLIAIASDKGVVEGRQNVVTLWVTPEVQAQLLIKEIQNRGYKKIAIVSATHDATEAFLSEFNKANQGIVEVALSEEFLTQARDFKPFIGKIKAKKDIDAIFVNLFFGQPGTFAKQVRELGLDIDFFGVEVFEEKSEIEASKGALIGAWYIQADDGKDNFIKRYSNQYQDATTYTAANCYDAVFLAAEWIKQDMSPTKFVTYLKTLKDFDGALGTYSATGDNRFTLPAVIKVVEKDGFRKLY